MRLQTLLLPIDFSDCAAQALAHAVFLARRHQAALHLLHAAPYDPDPSKDQTEKNEAVRSDLRALAEEADARDVPIEPIVRRGEEPAQAILSYARERPVDLIVMGTHGRRGLDRLFVGSVAEEVIRKAACPVFAVRERDRPFPQVPLSRVLVPIDFSEHSEQALAWAQLLAAAYGAPLALLHVVEDVDLPGIYGEVSSPLAHMPDVQERVKAGLRELVAARAPAADVSYHVVDGFAAGAIVDFAKQEAADLIVMSSHGRTGLQRFLMGSVAEKVLRRAPCPVFIVKAFGDRAS